MSGAAFAGLGDPQGVMGITRDSQQRDRPSVPCDIPRTGQREIDHKKSRMIETVVSVASSLGCQNTATGCNIPRWVATPQACRRG